MTTKIAKRPYTPPVRDASLTAPDCTCVACQDGDLRAAFPVPQPRRAVPGCGDDAAAVRAERRALHRILMPPQDRPGPAADDCARRRVPQFRNQLEVDVA